MAAPSLVPTGQRERRGSLQDSALAGYPCTGVPGYRRGMVRHSFFLGLTGSLLVAAACSGNDMPQCGDFAACGGESGGDAGTDAGDAGSDAATTFPCKGLECQVGKEACTINSENSMNDVPACTPLPAACTEPGATCDCFGTMDPICTCQQQPAGDFAVFCNQM